MLDGEVKKKFQLIMFVKKSKKVRKNIMYYKFKSRKLGNFILVWLG
jgi:hypothetical protein